MKLKNYSVKDSRIIQDNEGKSPDDLLELGLSQRGYRRMLEDSIDITQAKIEDTPAYETGAVLQPLKVEAINLQSVTAQYTDQRKSVTLHNKRSGRTLQMAYKAANLLAEKYPREFEILA
ncbi:MAG: hypothetical protein JST82_01585 [Bacteroidetes bacterium]|nr:hypothetical protein [Bacteroidota bacterium]